MRRQVCVQNPKAIVRSLPHRKDCSKALQSSEEGEFRENRIDFQIVIKLLKNVFLENFTYYWQD